jgi:acetyl esterase
MSRSPNGRRDFLKMTAVGAAGLALPAFGAKSAYDPAGKFAVKVSEVPFRRTPAGRELIARVYQPEVAGSSSQSAGPFPVLLDLQGGGWTRKDRSANEPMDRAIAASGVLVVAPDLRLSGEAPYPASVQDANYGVRWLKWKAAGWNGDASTLGVLGSSSGGHIGLLLAMRPGDPRYNEIKLAEAPKLDATFSYLVTRAPVSDPYARHLIAERLKKEELAKGSKAYFTPWENVHEGNPQEILDRREKVTLPPLLIMQGGADDHVIPDNQRKFAASWRAAGGQCQFELFDGAEHEWTANPGPNTDRSYETVKAFIARNLGSRAA